MTIIIEFKSEYGEVKITAPTLEGYHNDACSKHNYPNAMKAVISACGEEAREIFKEVANLTKQHNEENK